MVFAATHSKLTTMKQLSTHLCLFFANLAWACSYPLYKILMPTHITPMALFTAVMCIAAIISIISMLLDPDKASMRIAPRDLWVVAVAALLITIIRKGMLIFGLSITSPIDGSIISTITPVVVLIISLTVGLEVFSARRVLGVVLGLGGAVGVILTGGDSSHAAATTEGNMMMLGCAIISAVYVLWFKRLLGRYRPMVVLQWMFCITAIVVLPFGIDDLSRVDTSNWSTHTWLAFAYLVLIPTYLPNLLLTTGLKRATPTVASIYTYVQPVVAVGISLAMGLDKLHVTTLLFAALIFAGVGVTISSTKSGS